MLEIVYHLDKKTNAVEPFFKEEDGKDTYVMYKELMTEFEKMGSNERNKADLREILIMKHYFDLLQKGYSYKEIDEFLKQEIYQKKIGKYVGPLMEQRQILFDTTVQFTNGNRQQGLKEFYNDFYSKQSVDLKKRRR